MWPCGTGPELSFNRHVMFAQRAAGVVVISSNKTQRELHYSVQSTCGNISSVVVGVRTVTTSLHELAPVTTG